MGVGTGAYILTLHAIRHPNRMIGLILISSASQRASWWEWSFGRAALMSLRWPQTRHFAIEHFIQRLVTGRSLDLLHTIRTSISSISSEALYHYLKAVIDRRDLTSQIKHLQLTRVLVMWGYKALYKEDSQELNRAFEDKDRIAWIEVDECGNLLTEEAPFRILEEVKTFVRGLQSRGHCLDFLGLDS